jgi:hypothetical protein
MNEQVKNVVEILTLAGILLTAMRANLTLGQRSKKFLDDEERNERIAILVEGDPKEKRDSRIRRGLEGRVEQIEDSETVREKVFNAICLALEIPAATSDEHEIAERIRAKLGLPGLDDHEASRAHAMAERRRREVIHDQEQRFDRSSREPASLPQYVEQADPSGRDGRRGRAPLQREEEGTRGPREDDTGAHRRRTR